MTTIGLFIVGLVIAVGLAGIILPVLPGLLLCWGAILAWAVFEGTANGWIVFAGISVLFALSQVVKYLIPGQWMRSADVAWTTLAIGGLAGIVGFFVIPVIGLPLGFVAGVYAAERMQLGGHAAAWQSTVHAVKAVGLAILIELAAGLFGAVGWLGAVLFA